MGSEVGAWQVFLVACTVALFQGLGAVPLWIFDELGLSVSSYLILMASGMMVGTGLILVGSALVLPKEFSDLNSAMIQLTQGDITANLTSLFSFLSQQPENAQVLFGFLLGWLILHLCASFIQSLKHKPNENEDRGSKNKEHANDEDDESDDGCSEDDPLLKWLTSSKDDRGSSSKLTEDKAQMLVVILTMFAHSLGEGASIGVSYAMENAVNAAAHQTVVWSLCIHNIPEGLATCLFLVSRGLNKKQAALWSVFCDVPLPLTAVPAFLFVDTFEPLLPLSIGFAAGAMAYVSFVELIPECLDLLNHSDRSQNRKSDDDWMTFIPDKIKLIFVFVISAVAVFFLAD